MLCNASFPNFTLFRNFFLLAAAIMIFNLPGVVDASWPAKDFSKSADPFLLYRTENFFSLDNSSNFENDTCTELELEQFPVRMRTWLFNIMQQLSSYSETEGGLNKLELDLLYQAQEMENSNYIIPVHWKFGRLDKDKDGILAKAELTKFKQMLNPTENCITDFLRICDDNDNESVTKLEWTTCLKLSPDESKLTVEI